METKFTEVNNYVNGSFTTNGQDKMDVLSPLTGEVISTMPLSTEKDLDEAVKAAEAAYPAWSEMPIKERVQVFFKYKTLLEENIEELATLDPAFAAHLDAQAPIASQLEELAYALRPYASGVDSSPERLQAVEDRLARLERLKRRYGPTLSEVISRREQLRLEAAQFDSGTEREEGLRAQVAAARDTYLDVATALSTQRRSHATMLARTLERGLADLAMEDTRFEAVFDEPAADEAQWTDRGIDHLVLHALLSGDRFHLRSMGFDYC